MNAVILLALASLPDGPFVDVATALTITSSAAVVLDARGSEAQAPYLPSAQVVDWLDTRDGWLRTGRLHRDLEKVRRYFEAAGVRHDRPVLVYGAMRDGWGEEGRIWWSLRYLGHPHVYILDGGIQHWVRAGAPTARRAAPRPSRPGHLPSRIEAGWRADWKRVDELRQQPSATIIDVRTREEYDGATPFWSSRGGHVPGARWLYWKALIDDDGRILPREELRAELIKVGAQPDRPLITYCTGGVRSAFVIAAARQAGYTAAANYDGSWWDWSRRDVPVETSPP